MDEQTVWQSYLSFMARLTHFPPDLAGGMASALTSASENAPVETVWQTFQDFMARLSHLAPGAAGVLASQLTVAVYQGGGGGGPPIDPALFVLKAGDTMTGQLATNAGDPVGNNDLARKAYVDTLVGTPPGTPPDLSEYVLKAGDTLTGALRWNIPPAPGDALNITHGVIRILGGAIDVQAGVDASDNFGSEVRANWFVVPTDGRGLAFGSTGQDGGLYKKVGSGLVLRQSSGNQHIEVESNDGTEHWEIFDARGGGFRKDGTAPGNFGVLSWYERDGTTDTTLAQIYAGRRTDTNEPQILVRLPGQAQEFLWRSRIGTDGGPRLLLYHDPEVPLDAATKQYVDAAIAPLQARIAELEAQLAAKSST